MIVNSLQAQDFIARCMNKKLVPMLHGNPGIGKSDIVKSVAKKYKLKLIDERMSTSDPVDMNGYPTLEKGVAKYVPFETFPLTTRDTIPKGYNGWLVFLDELNSAPLSVQTACYKLLLDRQVGRYDLHDKVFLVAAGNLTTSGAIVNRIGTAMQSRLIHLELEVTAKAWLDWGAKNNVDHRILAYISHVPDNLHYFNPKHNDFTFACHRTWTFASMLIDKTPTTSLKELLPLLAGTISEGIAHEFVAYTEVYSRLPTYEQILADPINARLDLEPGMQFAATRMLAAYVTKKDLAKIMLYIERLPDEFQTIALQNIVGKDKTFINEKLIIDWALKIGAELF